MSVSEKALIENGRELVAVRRSIWDLERRQRFLTVSELAMLSNFRRQYRRLLAARKALVSQSQQRLF